MSIHSFSLSLSVTRFVCISPYKVKNSNMRLLVHYVYSCIVCLYVCVYIICFVPTLYFVRLNSVHFRDKKNERNKKNKNRVFGWLFSGAHIAYLVYTHGTKTVLTMTRANCRGKLLPNQRSMHVWLYCCWIECISNIDKILVVAFATERYIIIIAKGRGGQYYFYHVSKEW